MYHLDYQLTHDIDWFCRVNGIPVHVASNGGRLPYGSYTIKRLVSLQHRVANLPDQYRCNVNKELLTDYLTQGTFYPTLIDKKDSSLSSLVPDGFDLTEEIKDLPAMLLTYAWSFIEMAKKGFYSFDLAKTENGVQVYHLVAWPNADEQDCLPQEILNDLKEYYTNDYPHSIDSNVSCLPGFMIIQFPK